MKNIYAYTPEFCDGDYCPQDCDHCPKRDLIWEKEEEDDDE